MRWERPTELADLLGFLTIVDADYSDELGVTAGSAFADAWETLEYFISHTPTEEGKERLRECIRNLHVAFEYLEHGDNVSGSELVMETEQMFKRCRKYIALSDE